LNTLLWRFKFGISGFYGNVNEGWDESSVVHHIPTNWIKLFHPTDCWLNVTWLI